MKKTIRVAFFFLEGLVILAVLYVLIIRYPEPFFRYSISYDNIHLYSVSPLPASTEDLLKQAQSRLAASEIYNRHVRQNVFICGSPAQFEFFTNVGYRSSGLTYVYFNRSIFLRPSNIARNQLINYMGKAVTDDRTLVYYISHELTHSMTVSYVGAWKYHELPKWLKEGYADYIGKGPDTFADIQAKFEDSSYHTNREYLRYELMVAYLLDAKHISTHDLLGGNYAADLATAQAYLETLSNPGGGHPHQ